jgi:hypothetical protein
MAFALGTPSKKTAAAAPITSPKTKSSMYFIGVLNQEKYW